MEKLLNILGQLIPLIAFYPKWAQIIFLLSFGSVLLSLFVFVALYSTAFDSRARAGRKGQLEAELSDKAKSYLEVIKTSQDPKQLGIAVGYFKANPTEAALQPLATLAAREESDFVFVQSEAIEAMGAIKTDNSLKLLLERAVSETTPENQADYVKALYGFKDPSMVQPLISILETAGGDIVGYPSILLARKLNAPALAKAVKRHFDNVSKGPIHREYFELCREVIVQLQTKALHESVGLKLDLPKSLDLLLSRKRLADFQHEKDPKTIVVYLTYLRRNTALTENELATLAIEGLKSSDVLVRWSAAELAGKLDESSIETALRQTFQAERIPFIDAVLVDAFSKSWDNADCQLVGSKFKEYSVIRDGLSSYIDSAEGMVRHLIRHSCQDVAPSVELFARTLSEVQNHDKEAESMYRAVRALQNK